MRRKLVYCDPVMHAGPDGNSLLCVHCHSYRYVTVVDFRVRCPVCATEYKWVPRPVICAAPDHNGPGLCSNPACWKSKEEH